MKQLARRARRRDEVHDAQASSQKQGALLSYRSAVNRSASASISFAPAMMSFTSAAISIDVHGIAFVVACIPFDAPVQDMASEVIEEVDASKGEIDAFISMCSAGIEEHALLKDESAPLSGKPVEVKEIERKTIGMQAAEKEIDAGIPVMRDEAKGLPSKSIHERSRLKGMRQERR